MAQVDLYRQVCFAEYFAGDIQVSACLSVCCAGLDEQYRITLEQEQEMACCDLGNDLNFARRIFLAVVFGGVTACTLHDVVEDCMGTLF